MAEKKVPVNRTLVGLLALGCLGAALTLWVFASLGRPLNLYPTEELWRSAFTRVGLVMGAFWLALPGRNREAAWANFSPQTLIVFGVGLAAVVVRVPFRIVIPAVAVLLVLGLMLRPREKQRPPSRAERVRS